MIRGLSTVAVKHTAPEPLTVCGPIDEMLGWLIAIAVFRIRGVCVGPSLRPRGTPAAVESCWLILAIRTSAGSVRLMALWQSGRPRTETESEFLLIEKPVGRAVCVT